MSESVNTKVEKFFSPCLTLWWRGRGPKGTIGKLGAYWFPDGSSARSLLQQFMREAGFWKVTSRCTTEQLDGVLQAAGAYGYSIETRNEPE